MSKTLFWLALDLVAGLLVAGVLAALAVVLAPETWRGPGLVWGVVIPSVVGFGVLRRAVVRTPPGR